MKEPSDILKQVVELIEKDVNEIQKLSGEGKLHHQVAGDLVRYSAALIDLTGSLQESEQKKRGSLKGKTTEQLLQELDEWRKAEPK